MIDADRCIQCGTCVAVCPSNSIGIDEDTGLPELVKMCTGCSLCWDFCPRGGLRYEALWPPSTPTRPARTTTRRWCKPTPPTPTGRSPVARRATGWGRCSSATRCGPGPGPTTPRTAGWSRPCCSPRWPPATSTARWCPSPATTPSEPWKGVATVATTAKEIVAAAGSFYNQTMALAELDLSRYDLPAKPRPRRGGHPVRDPGDPGHAVAPVADRGAPGGRRGAHHRPALHQELRLRGAHAAAAARTSGASTSTGSARSTSSTGG